LSLRKVYLSPHTLTFLGTQGDPGRTLFSVIGVPLDSTSSFRSGTRFAPYSIRLMSQSLETMSLRTGIDVEDYAPYDEGNVSISHGNVDLSLRYVEAVCEDLVREGRLPILLGGEHTISVGSIRGIFKALGSDTCYLVLDAHADYRSEYLGFKLSHACTTRRVRELLGPSNVFIIGLRALSKDELRSLKVDGVRYVTSIDVLRLGAREVARRVNDFKSTCSRLYVSIDMDVFDPAYAPGVTTPEPEGLSPTLVFGVLSRVLDKSVVGIDVVEVSPPYDVGMITSALAAKVVLESIAYIVASGGAVTSHP